MNAGCDGVDAKRAAQGCVVDRRVRVAVGAAQRAAMIGREGVAVPLEVSADATEDETASLHACALGAPSVQARERRVRVVEREDLVELLAVEREAARAPLA